MKKVNIEVILKIMVLLGFFLFYFALLRDNTIINYVHPRIVPYAKISLVLMGIILLFLIFNIFKEKMVRRSLRKYAIFLVPLIVFIVVGNNGLSSTAKIQEEKNSVTTEEQILNPIRVDNNKKDNKEESNLKESFNKDKIVIDDKHYVDYLNKIGSNHKEYIGRDIEVTGFIYKDESMKDGEFALARYMMTCCAADMQMVGYLCHTHETVNFPSGTWVKINGKLEDEKDNVVIHVDNIERIESPEEGYVYPY